MAQTTTSLQEIPYNAIYVLFDVAQNALDFTGLLEFLKANPRKEIEFINANDFVDQRPGKNIQTENDMVSATIKTMRAKLDSDIAKALDAKKKFYAALEKQRIAMATASKSKKKSVKVTEILEPEEPKYDGKADILYVIYNIGFTPEQMDLLTQGGFPIIGFLAITPENPRINRYIKPEEPEEEIEPVSTTKSKKLSKPSPITTIPLIETSFTNERSADYYPPPKWDFLRPVIGDKMLFRELHVGSDFNNIINSIENEVVRMINANESFSYFNDKKTFIEIETATDTSLVDVSVFNKYVEQRPKDFINGIWAQLQAGNFSTREPDEDPEDLEIPGMFTSLFDNQEPLTSRNVVFQSQTEPEPIFQFRFLPQVYFHLYKLIHWKPKEENSAQAEAVFNFFKHPNNFHAYAGQKFDLLVQSMNKKYQLGLPNTFYDFQHWDLSNEHTNAVPILAEALHDAAVSDYIFDEDIGILWLMVMKPVPKVVGQFVTQYSMPQTLLDMSEWMTYIYDHRNDEEKKIKLINPALVQKGGLPYDQLLRPLKQRIEETDKYYKLPVNYSNEAHFRTPYFMPNGLHAEITRDVHDKEMTFNYSLYYNEIEIHSTSDSLVYQPIESITLYAMAKEFGITIFYDDQMLYFNGKELILNTCSTNERIMITLNGALILTKKSNVIIEANGAISTKVDDSWEYVDKDGETYINWHKVERPHSEIKDLATGTTKMIRPDKAEYYKLKNGNRKIIMNNNLTIDQSETAVDFDIPTYPLIHAENNVISCKIDRFDLEFSENHFSFKCHSYSIDVNDKASKVNIHDGELYLTSNRCEAKYENTVFVADIDGTEKVGTLLNEESGKKKRMDSIETTFGKIMPNKETNPEPVLLDLHTKYPARFFAIRSDFSICEFVRHDTLPKLTEKSATATYPITGERLKLISQHGIDVVPQVYIQHEALSKPARSTLLKEIKIPKATKNKPVTGSQPIEETIKTYFNNQSLVMTFLNNRLDLQQNEYLKDIQPKPVPPPEILKIPPQTPPPRIQIMQYNLYQPKPEHPNYNYWLTHESDFGYPLIEIHEPERPLSPRTQMFDAPRIRLRNTVKDIPVHEDEEPRSSRQGSSRISFITEPLSTMKYRDMPEEDSRPKIARIQPDIMDFGDIKVGTDKTISISVTNIGIRPIHYSFTQIPNEFMKVVSLPGAIFPGLKTSIAVELSGVPTPQLIETSFQFTSRKYTLTIPVRANITE